MDVKSLVIAAIGTLILSGCIEGTGIGGNGPIAIGEDTGRDARALSALEAGIYIDPDGCHIWMIDDGLEGYWSRRLDPRSGLPVCTAIAPPNSVVGNINNNDSFPDFRPRRR